MQLDVNIHNLHISWKYDHKNMIINENMQSPLYIRDGYLAKSVCRVYTRKVSNEHASLFVCEKDIFLLNCGEEQTNTFGK